VERFAMRALVVGRFSTVGDLEVLRQVEQQLVESAVPYEVGAFEPTINKGIPGSVDIKRVDPQDYTHLLVVCGPLHREYLAVRRINLDRFAHCTRIGVNLTMLDDLEMYDPLDVMLGRDSNHWTKPDLAFREHVPTMRVAGICLVPSQDEYGPRRRHDRANQLLRSAAARNGLAPLALDTEFPADHNAGGIGSPEEFESICRRVDLMLTTRLHGMVIALKNGVPVVAVDSISGGAKVTLQARAIGWPEIYSVDDATDQELDEAIERCLAPEGRDRAQECAARARQMLTCFPNDFQEALRGEPQRKRAYTPLSRVRRFRIAARDYILNFVPARTRKWGRTVVDATFGPRKLF
jgi:hypothetical protein